MKMTNTWSKGVSYLPRKINNICYNHTRSSASFRWSSSSESISSSLSSSSLTLEAIGLPELETFEEIAK